MIITNTIAMRAGLSATSAQLLYRVAYWFPKTKVEREGRRYITMTRLEWCADTGLSIDQYKRASLDLKRRGFIQVEQHLWNNKPVTWLRLTVRASKGADGEPVLTPDVEQKPPAHVEQNCSPYVEQICAPYVERNCSTPIDKKVNPEGYDEGCHRAIALGGLEETPIEPTGEGMPSTVASIAAALRAKQKQKRAEWREVGIDPARKETPTDLHDIWKKAVGELGIYANALSGQDRGSFLHLCKTAPPGAARAIVSAALQDWPGLCAYLEVNAGAYKLPAQPAIWLLYRYADAVITWWKVKQDEPKTVSHGIGAALAAYAPPPAPSTLVPAPPPVGPSEADKYAQLVALFGEEDAKAEWLSTHPSLPTTSPSN